MELGQVLIDQCELKQENEKLLNLIKKRVICDSLQLDKKNKHHAYLQELRAFVKISSVG